MTLLARITPVPNSCASQSADRATSYLEGRFRHGVNLHVSRSEAARAARECPINGKMTRLPLIWERWRSPVRWRYCSCHHSDRLRRGEP